MSTTEIGQAWHRSQCEATPKRARTCAWVGIGAFVGFAPLDHIMLANMASGEQRLVAMLWARAAIVLLLLGVVAISRRGLECPLARASGLICVLVIGAGVSILTAMCGGGAYGYHTSLAVTLFAALSFVPMSTRQTVVASLWMVSFHHVLLWQSASLGDTSTALNNLSTLVLAAIAGSISTYSHNAAKVMELSLGLEKSKLIAQLKKLDGAKNAFFANVSHELRTPLMLTIASIDSVQEQHKADSKFAQQIQVGRRNSVRLLRLVDDLLELSKLESDTMALRLGKVDVAAFLADLSSQTQTLAERKGIAIVNRIVACPALFADPHQLERVFLNLLANAIKFTPAGGTITVNVRPQGAPEPASENDKSGQKTKKEGVLVTVSDTGEGIPVAALPHIFERFYQATPSQKAKRGGVGIGLSLCKRIVEMHNGHIWASSQEGHGSTLSFWMPLQPDAYQASGSAELVSPTAGTLATPSIAAKPSPGAGGQARPEGLPEWDTALREAQDYRFFDINEVSNRRAVPRSDVKHNGPPILVVDDNHDILEFLAGALGADYEVWAASDGLEALTLARRHRPELIISDVVMPNMGGFDLLHAVRDDASLHGIPFVLMTARGDPEDRRRGDQAQADAMLPKPFVAGDLRPIIERLLGRAQGQASQMQDAAGLALRMMAAGIAHDILNPVGFLKNALIIVRQNFGLLATFVDRAQEKPAAEARADGVDFLNTADEGVLRVIAAVDQLRRFARGEISDTLTPINTTGCIERIITMTRPHGIFTTDFKATRPAGARAGQLEEVLLNLVLNALQAGGNTCRISLSTWTSRSPAASAFGWKTAAPA